MIDIENRVFTGLKKHLESSVGKISLSSEFSAVPSSFPHVSFCEEDNNVYDKTIDSGSNENHAKVMFEVNVYSNKANGRKTECKNIFEQIDNYMLGLGFARISKSPISTKSLFRIVARYQGIVAKNFEIYRR